MSMNLSSYLGVFAKWTPYEIGVDWYEIVGDDAIYGVYDEGSNLPNDCIFLIPNTKSECRIGADYGDSGFAIIDEIDVPGLKIKFESQFHSQIYKLSEFGKVEILFGSIRCWG